MKRYLFARRKRKYQSDRELSVNQACLFAQVQKHLSKLFDNMAKMQFEADGEGNPSKTSLGMYSKEEEYVPFNQCCDCTGQVKYTHDLLFMSLKQCYYNFCRLN